MNQSQSQEQSQSRQQVQYRQVRPAQTTGGKKCFYCGASMPVTAEICPHCGRPTNPNVCTFCGAPMDPNDRFCCECGNSREGIVCPECGTLNFRSFCRKCNHPLDHMALQAVEEAQRDPKFQRMCQLQQRMAELEQRILESAELTEEADEEVELSAEDQALVSEYESILAMLQNDGVPQPKQEEQPAPQAETPKRKRLTISLEQMKELAQDYKQSVQELNDAMADLAPDPGASPQMQRNYFCARKLPVVTVTRHKEIVRKPVEWVCNYCGCHHSQPSECVEPQLGGTWIYQNIEIDQIITEKHWVEE